MSRVPKWAVITLVALIAGFAVWARDWVILLSPLGLFIAALFGIARALKGKRGKALTPNAFALLFSVLANLFMAALNSLPALAVPRGTPIRPMGLVAFDFVFALIAAVVGVPLSIRAGVREKWSPWLALSMVLALTPLPAGIFSLRAAAHLRGLWLEP